MKKILLLIIIFTFILNSQLVYSEEDVEIIGIDHDRGIVLEIREAAVSVGDLILNQIDNVFSFLEDEIVKRQKIIEDQVETRKENFFKRLTKKIKNAFNQFIDSLFNSFQKKVEKN